MSKWNIVLWVAAAVLAFCNVMIKEQNGTWVLITALFAANAVRALVLYRKERNEKNDG